MDTNDRPAGTDTEADLQRHLFELETEALAEDGTPFPQDPGPTAPAEQSLDAVRAELETLRLRLSLIRENATSAAKANVRWVDASAHSQLGDYPWAKLAGAAFATVIATRMLRQLPLTALAAAAIPLLTARDGRKRPFHARR